MYHCRLNTCPVYEVRLHHGDAGKTDKEVHALLPFTSDDSGHLQPKTCIQSVGSYLLKPDVPHRDIRSPPHKREVSFQLFVRMREGVALREAA